MENASKALIMAASVLMGIMILSLAVYLFATFGASSAELHKQQAIDKKNQFNSQFTSYEDKDNLTIYDVVTVANLATENNKYYEFEKRLNYRPTETSKVSDYYVAVIIKRRSPSISTSNIEGGLNSTNYDELIQNEITTDLNNMQNSKLSIYKCKTYISTITERVYRVDLIQQ